MFESEYLRRGLQMLVSGKFFDAPGLSSLRMCIYRFFFKIGRETLVVHDTLFTRPHHLKSGYLILGKRVGINHHVEIDYSGGVEIEDDVWISQYVLIETHKHAVKTKALKKDQEIQLNALSIGRDAWIGANVVILPGVKKIGKGAVVGAGSIVTKDVPDYMVVAGNPAKRIGRRGDESPLTV